MEELKTISFYEVVEFFFTAHKGQTRKNCGIPYFTHSLSVLKRVASKWGIQDRQIWDLCVSHDVFEDCPHIMRNEVVDVIGEETTCMVEELTFKPLKSFLTPAEQKANYMSSFNDKSVQALIVKLADRCDNTMDFLDSDPDYASKYWRNADHLFDALISREEEIVAKYGIGAFANMKFDRGMVGQMTQ